MTGNKYDRLDTKHISEGTYDEVMRNRAVYGDPEGHLPSFFRYVILDVISDPSTLDKVKLSYYEHELGVGNISYAAVAPRNSIIARRVMAADAGAAEKVMVLYPFFPSHMSMPAKPGEHVWVMFENPGAKTHELGYWMCRIVQPNFVEDVNYTHADRQFDKSFLPGLSDVFEGSDDPVYEFRNGAVDTKDGKRYAIGGTMSLPGDDTTYEKLLTETDASKTIKYEPVPRYRKRPADLAFEGSNNTLIVLGTDRSGPVSEYDTDPNKGQVPKAAKDDVTDAGAGMIDLVAGRGQTPDTGGKPEDNKLVSGGNLNKELGKSKKDLQAKEGDPDYKTDRSRVLISQRVPVDKRFGLDKYQSSGPDKTGKGKLKDKGNGDGAIVIKTDKVRIIARSDVQFLVEGATDRDENGNLKPGTDSSKWASITIKSSGDIVFLPSATGLIRIGGDDADLSPLCQKTGNSPGMPGPVPTPPPIVDTMGGAQGTGALNGEFATKVLFK